MTRASDIIGDFEDSLEILLSEGNLKITPEMVKGNDKSSLQQLKSIVIKAGDSAKQSLLESLLSLGDEYSYDALEYAHEIKVSDKVIAPIAGKVYESARKTDDKKQMNKAGSILIEIDERSPGTLISIKGSILGTVFYDKAISESSKDYLKKSIEYFERSGTESREYSNAIIASEIAIRDSKKFDKALEMHKKTKFDVKETEKIVGQFNDMSSYIENLRLGELVLDSESNKDLQYIANASGLAKTIEESREVFDCVVEHMRVGRISRDNPKAGKIILFNGKKLAESSKSEKEKIDILNNMLETEDKRCIEYSRAGISAVAKTKKGFHELYTLGEQISRASGEARKKIVEDIIESAVNSGEASEKDLFRAADYLRHSRPDISDKLYDRILSKSQGPEISENITVIPGSKAFSKPPKRKPNKNDKSICIDIAGKFVEIDRSQYAKKYADRAKAQSSDLEDYMTICATLERLSEYSDSKGTREKYRTDSLQDGIKKHNDVTDVLYGIKYASNNLSLDNALEFVEQGRKLLEEKGTLDKKTKNTIEEEKEKLEKRAKYERMPPEERNPIITGTENNTFPNETSGLGKKDRSYGVLSNYIDPDETLVQLRKRNSPIITNEVGPIIYTRLKDPSKYNEIFSNKIIDYELKNSRLENKIYKNDNSKIIISNDDKK